MISRWHRTQIRNHLMRRQHDTDESHIDVAIATGNRPLDTAGHRANEKSMWPEIRDRPFCFCHEFLLHYSLPDRIQQHCNMNRMQRPSLKFTLGLLMLSGLILMIAGCAGSRSTTPIHETPLGTVFLENASNSSFQAAHPIKLSETTIADILRGVHTKEKTGLLLLLGKALKSTNLNDIRTFSEDDIAFLTPHIALALAQATPNQRVGFHIYSTPVISPSPKMNQNRETTSGYLFADGLSLHFRLTQYRFHPGKKSTAGLKEPRPLPDTDGLRDREVTFLPEAAVRPDVYDRSGWMGNSEDRSIAIDYQLLARVLAAPPPSAPVTQPIPPVTAPAPPPQTIPVQAPPVGRQDTDLQAFKEEMKALRKKVDEQEAELQRLKNPSLKTKPTR